MLTLKRRDLIKAAALGLVGASMGSQRAGAQVVNPRAKRFLHLFMPGAPSQLELFDYKPMLSTMRNQPLPPSVLEGLRITSLTTEDRRIANPLVSFAQYGQSGMWFSDLLPNMSKLADSYCQIKSMYTDAVNHDPAINLMLTGSQLPGRPSLGAWLSYGLGSLNPNLPSFVALQSATTDVSTIQPLSKRAWGAGFLPSKHQGVDLRPGNAPVYYLDDGIGITDGRDSALFNAVRDLNVLHHQQVNNPDILRRNESYEMASVLQGSMADLADESDEPDATYDAYGPESRTPGSYAANCLRARRLLERDVRCVMVSHRGWDQHFNCDAEIRRLTSAVDQPTAALLTDLEARGLLEDTLVVWGGEFGRSVYNHGEITDTEHGRDHSAYAFPAFLAGAGVKKGIVFGETDDFSMRVVANPVHVHDLQATILDIMGLEQTALSYNHDGRDFRLTDLGGRIVSEIMS